MMYVTTGLPVNSLAKLKLEEKQMVSVCGW